MRNVLLLAPLMVCLGLSSCSQSEEEIEPDYDNMVLLDDPDEWFSDEEKDRKVIATDRPDPQELIIMDPEEQTQ